MPNSLRLTLREFPSGGGLLDEAEGPRSLWRERETLVFLVHGFNVSKSQAKTSYEQFEAQLRACAPHLVDNCCWVFWPGDAWVPVLRNAVYPRRISHARDSGQELADFIRQAKTPRGDRPKVVFIAHSLGCRVVLEALQALASDPGAPTPSRVTLFVMAAAVPFLMLGESLPLRQAADYADRRYTLFSPGDSVLSRYFRMGQILAGDGTESPIEAVGLWGRPSVGVWTGHCNLWSYDHSDYWDSHITASLIAHWLGNPVAMPSPVRALPLVPPAPEREAPFDRPIPDERIVSSRQMSGSRAA